MFGGRYQWQGGLDCAGFVCLVFDRIGIDVDPAHALVYTNAQRILEASEPIAAGTEQAGDLVFFEGTYATPGASHIGIVKDPGKGLMLDDHTRNPYGPGETVYTSAYWAAHLLGFGRVHR